MNDLLEKYSLRCPICGDSKITSDNEHNHKCLKCGWNFKTSEALPVNHYHEYSAIEKLVFPILDNNEELVDKFFETIGIDYIWTLTGPYIGVTVLGFLTVLDKWLNLCWHMGDFVLRMLGYKAKRCC